MTANPPIIETARLILRLLDLWDADAVQALFPRWEIVKFLAAAVPWPYPADGALSYIRDSALAGMREGNAMALVDPSQGRAGKADRHDQPEGRR